MAVRKTSSKIDPVAQLDDSLTLLQDQRTQALIDSLTYQRINHQALEREQARLHDKYGPEHPRVQAMSARLAYNEVLFSSLTNEISRSKQRQEPLPDGGWRVQGQVIGKGDVPLAKLNIYLLDRKHEAIKELDYACTDEEGYYAITLTGKQVERQQQNPLYLAVSDANRTVLYRSGEPLQARPDAVDMRDIELDGKDCPSPFDQTEKEDKKDTE